MSDLTAFFLMALTFLIMIASPGPATMSNAAIAMRYGQSPSLAYGAGLSCGLTFWGALAASGMGASLYSSPLLLGAVKVAGGLYLCWLAKSSAQIALSSSPDFSQTDISRNHKWFFQGLILNLSNPKAVLAWMAALSVAMGDEDGFVKVLSGTVICVVVGFAANALYTLFFSRKGMMQLYQRFSRYVEGAMAVLFMFAGIGLLYSVFA
tara:strand:- start:73 stop:696 length:624 start_codon:yes stop_codon:yes gene_type:complete